MIFLLVKFKLENLIKYRRMPFGKLHKIVQ